MGTAKLSSIGGPADQKVFDGIVQEIDIPTGKLLFQWNSADHVPFRDSHNPRPGSAASQWDWFHINAVHLDTDGNLLINSRFTWTTYKVDLQREHPLGTWRQAEHVQARRRPWAGPRRRWRDLCLPARP